MLVGFLGVLGIFFSPEKFWYNDNRILKQIISSIWGRCSQSNSNHIRIIYGIFGSVKWGHILLPHMEQIQAVPCFHPNSSSFLVGGFNPSEKYESQIGSSSPLLGKTKKCSKQPTSFGRHFMFTPNLVSCSGTTRAQVTQFINPQGTPQGLLIGRILGAAAPVKSAHIKPQSWRLYQLYPTLW